MLNDYEVVVQGLRSMLEPHAGRIEVVETEVIDGEGSGPRRRGAGDRPVDLTLYDTFGRTQVDQDAIDEVLADPAAGSVVVYTWNMQGALVDRAVEKGCSGYLDKSLSADELVRSLESVAAGETVVSPIREYAEERSTAGGAWPGRRHGLTEREAEMIALIAQGYTNPEIAARSYITGNSLKSYIRSAYRKIGVERRSQAVRWGIEHGMLPDEETRPGPLGSKL
nr:response regulator transcription factor [Leucobacter weissii]